MMKSLFLQDLQSRDLLFQATDLDALDELLTLVLIQPPPAYMLVILAKS